MKKIPIGIQAFSSLIEGGFVYLDKTDMIYNIANTKACYFLSRPRRFGKSLTLSTLHEYFDGQKDLFVGTKMEKLETKWEKYPVVHFDFSSATYDTSPNKPTKKALSHYLCTAAKVKKLFFALSVNYNYLCPNH
ncbi:MAG: AAA family ATPase [Bacteroidales bacterium]|nr:AAA family ATPase [Bacteroidales bacterium]MBR4676541.1 AAA family ATPase [Bacteroidales bacterium]